MKWKTLIVMRNIDKKKITEEKGKQKKTIKHVRKWNDMVHTK